MPDSHSTLEVAHLLGLSVRSVQLMVDRGELTAWKTPGGHRRILRDSVARWLEQRGLRPPRRRPQGGARRRRRPPARTRSRGRRPGPRLAARRRPATIVRRRRPRASC